MKKFLSALIALILLLPSIAAAEKNPVRIARLPIIFKSEMPDRDTCAELEMKIARAIHIPLNKTLKVAEFLPTKNSTKALDKILQGMSLENKNVRLQDAMKPLSEKLDADIVICPILFGYNQYIDNLSGFGETYLHSYAGAELIIYDRRDDNLIDKKNSRMYNDVMSTTGTANHLAKICFDKTIDDTKIRQLIMNIGKKNDN